MITEAIKATKLLHIEWMEKQAKECESICIYIERERERSISIDI